MKKVFFPVLLTGILIAFASQIAFAGGIDNKQNFSARYVGAPTRNAAIEGADVSAYNPAGIMMQENGFAIEGDFQYVMKNYEHSYPLDTRYQETNAADEPSMIPTMFLTYKRDKWAVFGSFTVNGGGGEVDYKNGNAASYMIGSSFLSAQQEHPDIPGYFVNPFAAFSDDKIMAESIYYTFTTGGAFKFGDKFSVALAGRYIKATKTVEASATVTYNPLVAAGNGYPPTTDLIAGYDQDATGYGYVVSLDYKPLENLNFGLRYDSAVELNWDTDYSSKTNDLGTLALVGNGIEDGEKYRRDLPGLVGFGVSWDVIKKLNLGFAFTYYLEESADWNGQEDVLDSNTFDAAISGTYSFNEKIYVSGGYMYTDTGMDAADYGLTEMMSPPLDCHTFALGTGYAFTEKLRLDFGLMSNNYVEDKTSTVAYNKHNYALSLGLQWRPF